MSDFNEGRHPLAPRSNCKVVPPYIPPPRKESLEAENARLKAEVERLTADLNKMTKTPEGVDYVEVDVSFWTKSGSRLPSSYSTFWSNDKGVQS